MVENSIIHIGYHKTGTTFFQNAFYPTVQNAQYIDPTFIHKNLLNIRPFDFSPERFRKQLNRVAEQRSLILCSEDISGHVYNGGLHGCFTKEMALRLQQCFPDAQIVIFIRNQLAMLVSCYLFYVQGGGTLNADDFIQYHQRFSDYVEPYLTLDHFSYDAMVNFYVELFGRSQVHVFLYEDFAADNDAFLAQYAKHFHLQVNKSEVHYEKVNSTFSPRALWFLRKANLLTGRGRQPRNYLIHAPHLWAIFYKLAKQLSIRGNGQQPQPTDIFSDSIIRDVRTYFAECNRRLVNEWQLNLDLYQYPGF